MNDSQKQEISNAVLVSNLDWAIAPLRNESLSRGKFYFKSWRLDECSNT